MDGTAERAAEDLPEVPDAELAEGDLDRALLQVRPRMGGSRQECTSPAGAVRRVQRALDAVRDILRRGA